MWIIFRKRGRIRKNEEAKLRFSDNDHHHREDKVIFKNEEIFFARLECSLIKYNGM